MKCTHDEALRLVREARLVAILRHVPFEKLDGVVSELIAGGIRVLEFTFDHDSPADIERNQQKIRYAAEHYGKEILLGCGTALSAAEVEATQEAGGQLVITPCVDPQVIRRARELDMVAMPGALTPTEIVNACNAGADVVKLFPAGEMGLGYIKAVRGPLSFIPMFGVGGVKPENVADFLNAGLCGFGVGGQLVLPDAVKSGDYAAIRRRAEAFTEAIRAWEERQ